MDRTRMTRLQSIASAGSLTSVLFGNDHDTFQGTYIQGQSTTYDPNHVSDTGNYLVFHDVVGSSFTLSSTGIGSTAIAMALRLP